MKFSNTAFIALALSGAFAHSSCIRDDIEKCPGLEVNIVVKDKNYFNVNKVELENRVSEDLPFKSYVPTIAWVLRDVETGTVMDSSNGLITVSGDEQSVRPDICPCVPHGRYALTVWGGLESTEQLSDYMERVDFHPENIPGADIYMTNDTIRYDAWHNGYTVELERAKGKLIIEKIDVPEEIERTDKTVTGIYSWLDAYKFQYGGETSVKVSTEIEDHANTVTKTMLAPSIKRDASKLNVRFTGTDENGAPATIDTRNVTINMSRNELTVLRYVWDKNLKRFNIYMLVNDSWEIVNRLDVE